MSAPTYVACLTPAGTAAIATLGVCGPNAWPLIAPLFKPSGRAIPVPRKERSVWLGRLGDDWSDQVVLTLQGSEDAQAVEIHCHGGPAVVRGMLDLLRSRGCAEVGWEDWLRRSQLAPIRAEAAIALAHATTTRVAAILLDQYQGTLDRELAEIGRLACSAASRSDAELRLKALARWIPLGRHLTRPWRVVVAGAPNVGKSSLVNALLGYQRSITSPIPGTTRDVVTTLSAIDGWPVELFDTAGLRSAAGLEERGVARARAAGQTADLCLWVTAVDQPPAWPEEDWACPLIPVVNKIDLPRTWTELPPRLALGAFVSALTAQGLTELLQRIGNALVPAAPPPTAAVPFTDRLCELIQSALDALESGHVPAALAWLEACESRAARID